MSHTCARPPAGVGYEGSGGGIGIFCEIFSFLQNLGVIVSKNLAKWRQEEIVVWRNREKVLFADFT